MSVCFPDLPKNFDLIGNKYIIIIIIKTNIINTKIVNIKYSWRSK